MAVINVKIVVYDLDNVMSVFDRIKVYRSTTGLTGSYTEITTPATRILLDANTTVYEFVDTAGDPSYYYKSSYFNALSSLESSLSDAVQGEGDPALDIISVAELQTNYLFGLDLTDDSGNPFPDSLYEWFIKSAVSWLEHRLDLPLRPKIITEERHPYIKEDYRQYLWMRVKEYPIISVEEVKLVLPGEQVVKEFDSSWIYPEHDSGVIQILPGSGTAGTILLGASGAWIPIVYGANRYIPGTWSISYTAGFAPGSLPYVFKDLVGKVASFGPLNIAGDLLGGAGIASQAISIDGLSQSFNTTSSATNAGYGARLVQYNREIKEQIPTLRNSYKGINMVVV